MKVIKKNSNTFWNIQSMWDSIKKAELWANSSLVHICRPQKKISSLNENHIIIFFIDLESMKLIKTISNTVWLIQNMRDWKQEARSYVTLNFSLNYSVLYWDHWFTNFQVLCGVSIFMSICPFWAFVSIPRTPIIAVYLQKWSL